MNIPHPRLGFYGVVDERFDVELLKEMAYLRPEWQFVIIGPVIKIDEAMLPRNSNIHYLGPKNYTELPNYLSGWDIAIMPFALNESTKYISPTKTPEYLAGGKPVISTSIRDVVEPYGKKHLVHIADNSGDFILAAEKIFAGEYDENWLKKVDEYLKDISWNATFRFMNEQVKATLSKKQSLTPIKSPEYV